MRTAPTVLVITAILFGVALLAATEDPDARKKIVEEKIEDAKTRLTALAKLDVRWHRLSADLIEARMAEKPDAAKIVEIDKELRQIDEELRQIRRELHSQYSGSFGRQGDYYGFRRRYPPGVQGFGRRGNLEVPDPTTHSTSSALPPKNLAK